MRRGCTQALIFSEMPQYSLAIIDFLSMRDSFSGMLEPALSAPENQLCTSLPNSEFSDLKLIA